MAALPVERLIAEEWRVDTVHVFELRLRQVISLPLFSPIFPDFLPVSPGLLAVLSGFLALWIPGLLQKTVLMHASWSQDDCGSPTQQ